MEDIYDIIIAGTGPVGLTFADKLADSGLRILVYDHGKIGTTKKSWAVPEKWLATAGYSHYATNRITRLGVYSYLHEESVIQTVSSELAGVTIAESKLLPDIFQRIKAKGVDTIENLEMLSWQEKSDHLELISSTKKIFKTKLILDCTGVNSRFIKRGNNIKHLFYYPTYGLKFSGGNSAKDQAYIAAHVANYKGSKVFINDFHEGDGAYTPWIYITTSNETPLLELRDLYKEILKTEFVENLVTGHDVIGEKFGWIPVWDVKSRASNRILSLGDAGAMAPWTSAATLSFMLSKLPVWVPKIIDSVKNDNLAEAELNSLVKLSNQQEALYDLTKIIFILLKNSSPEEFKKVVEFYAELNLDILSKAILYFDASVAEITSLIRILLKHLSIPELLRILARDGLHDELGIGPELLVDIMRNI